MTLHDKQVALAVSTSCFALGSGILTLAALGAREAVLAVFAFVAFPGGGAAALLALVDLREHHHRHL